MSSNRSPNATPAGIRIIVTGIGGACALLGSLVVVGWQMHLPVLIQIRPELPPMQYNTAVCFILAGLALVLRACCGGSRVVAMLGGLIMAIGTLTLAEYLSHIDLGIDQALFHSYITVQTSQVGRMSPVSALCFALAGFAFLCLSLRDGADWRAPLAGSIASIIISVSLVAVLGYIFGLPGTYGWGQLTRVAAHTAAGLGLVGAALFIIAWSRTLHPGERTPRWLPVPLVLGVFVASLILYL
jgi:hypothetical protein